MRKLLNTLFVLTEDSYLSLDGENVVVNRGGAEAARFPLHTLEGILTFAYPGASPALMGACAKRGVDLAFFSPRGRFLARTVGEERGNVLLRQEQYRASDSPCQPQAGQRVHTWQGLQRPLGARARYARPSDEGAG